MRKNSANRLPVSTWVSEIIPDLPNYGCPVLDAECLRGPLQIELNEMESQIVFNDREGIGVALSLRVTNKGPRTEVYHWEIGCPELNIDCLLIDPPDQGGDFITHSLLPPLPCSEVIFNGQVLNLAKRSQCEVILLATRCDRRPDVRNGEIVEFRLIAFDALGDPLCSCKFPIMVEVTKSKRTPRGSTLFEGKVERHSNSAKRLNSTYGKTSGVGVPTQQSSTDGEKMTLKR